MRHKEQHRTDRIGWLRAAVLGANDGIVSTASLVIGVAAASAARSEILLAGVAGLVAGAMSMAAGEYVSVSSQADIEHADLDRERRELAADPDVELDELAAIYESRGLDAPLARQVAEKPTAHDALSAHARDELSISQTVTARPVQAAFVSAATFAVGAAMPVLTVLIATGRSRIPVVALMSLVFLALLGGVGAHAGGASVRTGAIRVTFWGAMAMAITAAIGGALRDHRVMLGPCRANVTPALSIAGFDSLCTKGRAATKPRRMIVAVIGNALRLRDVKL